MILVLSIMSIFITVFVLSLLLLMPAAEKRQVGKSLGQMLDNVPSGSGSYSLEAQKLDLQTFAERVVRPSLTWLLNLVKKVTPIEIVNYYKHQIVFAGSPRDLNVDKFLSLKVLFTLFGLVILILLAVMSSISKSKIIFPGLLLIPFAFFLPDLWLIMKAEKRQKEIRLALPDTLDLLTISVEAGLGFDAALTKVIKNSKGPLAEECSKMLSESQIGVSREEALKNLAERSNSTDLRAFVTAMIQADIFGISISKVLRTQAGQIRLKRRQKAEEIAMKAPVKIVFPVVLCIFPSLFVVILGPAAIRIYFTLLPILRGK